MRFMIHKFVGQKLNEKINLLNYTTLGPFLKTFFFIIYSQIDAIYPVFPIFVKIDNGIIQSCAPVAVTFT